MAEPASADASSGFASETIPPSAGAAAAPPALPFAWTHFPAPTQMRAAPQAEAESSGTMTAHPYLPGVGGARYSLMTEWDDLVLAVRCAWEVPADMRAEAAAPAGPGEALLRHLRATPRWMPAREPGLLPPRPVACPDDFYRALRWAFDRARAAVLVSIRRGRLVLFLPFANDGGWRLPDDVRVQLPRGLASVADYAAEKHRTQRTKRREDMIPDARRWWLNGHVVCNVRPADVWGDFQLADLHEMVEAALALHPAHTDVDLLLNKRDCPLLVNPHLHAGQPRLPVLSPYTSSAALDLPFPLADDWRLAKEAEGMPAEAVPQELGPQGQPRAAAGPTPDTPSPFARWDQRAPRAVFRGSSTGRGLTAATNLRLALAFFAARPEASPWLDVRITRVNERCQVLCEAEGAASEPKDAGRPASEAKGSAGEAPKGEPRSAEPSSQPNAAEPATPAAPAAPAARTLRVDYPKALELRAALREAGVWGPFETLAAQARRFRMAIYVRGHQAASRLGALFRAGFCVVMLRPPGEEFDAPGCLPWFHDKLDAYEGWRPGASGKSGGSEDRERSDSGGIGPAGATGDPERSEAVRAHLEAEPVPRDDVMPEPTAKRAKKAAGGVGPAAHPAADPAAHPAADPAAHPAADPAASPPPPLASDVVCVVRSLEELLECVKFLAAHDPIARALAENGHRIIGAMLTQEGIARRAAEVIAQAARNGRAPAVSPCTHPLFGMTNPAMAATRSARFEGGGGGL